MKNKILVSIFLAVLLIGTVLIITLLNIWILEDERLNVLKESGVKYLFVDVGDTNINGQIETPEKEIRDFITNLNSYESANSYDFTILPYSEINTYTYDIESEEFQDNFIADYLNLIKLGFDGVYLDIEPV